MQFFPRTRNNITGQAGKVAYSCVGFRTALTSLSLMDQAHALSLFLFPVLGPPPPHRARMALRAGLASMPVAMASMDFAMLLLLTVEQVAKTPRIRALYCCQSVVLEDYISAILLLFTVEQVATTLKIRALHCCQSVVPVRCWKIVFKSACT